MDGEGEINPNHADIRAILIEKSVNFTLNLCAEWTLKIAENRHGDESIGIALHGKRAKILIVRVVIVICNHGKIVLPGYLIVMDTIVTDKTDNNQDDDAPYDTFFDGIQGLCDARGIRRSIHIPVPKRTLYRTVVRFFGGLLGNR